MRRRKVFASYCATQAPGYRERDRKKRERGGWGMGSYLEKESGGRGCGNFEKKKDIGNSGGMRGLGCGGVVAGNADEPKREKDESQDGWYRGEEFGRMGSVRAGGVSWPVRGGLATGRGEIQPFPEKQVRRKKKKTRLPLQAKQFVFMRRGKTSEAQKNY